MASEEASADLASLRPGRSAGQGSVCLFRKTVRKGQCSVYLANSGGIAGDSGYFTPGKGMTADQ